MDLETPNIYILSKLTKKCFFGHNQQRCFRRIHEWNRHAYKKSAVRLEEVVRHYIHVVHDRSFSFFAEAALNPFSVRVREMDPRDVMNDFDGDEFNLRYLSGHNGYILCCVGSFLSIADCGAADGISTFFHTAGCFRRGLSHLSPHHDACTHSCVVVCSFEFAHFAVDMLRALRSKWLPPPPLSTIPETTGPRLVGRLCFALLRKIDFESRYTVCPLVSDTHVPPSRSSSCVWVLIERDLIPQRL